MADFTALKSAIQTYIKQNGNEEITGEKLQEILLSVVTTLGDSAINDLVTALANEVTARQNADGTLQQNITNEATARGNADTALGGRIDDEATARANGDTALSNRLGSTITAENTAADQIGAEAEARAAADTALQELIDGITNNIENGYVYAGIATPSSTPATGKVFYLALTAGTYTHFGSTVVSQGINILKYNGSAWSLDAFIGIDDELTPSSNNLPKSGNVLENIIKNGSAFDLSAYNAVDGVLATYADLDAALTALNALPAVYKQGGMSFRFVRTSDNKYIQARCMAQNFSTDPNDWQGVDTEITAGSRNLAESGSIIENMSSIYNNLYSITQKTPISAADARQQYENSWNVVSKLIFVSSKVDNANRYMVCFWDAGGDIIKTYTQSWFKLNTNNNLYEGFVTVPSAAVKYAVVYYAGAGGNVKEYVGAENIASIRASILAEKNRAELAENGLDERLVNTEARIQDYTQADITDNAGNSNNYSLAKELNGAEIVYINSYVDNTLRYFLSFWDASGDEIKSYRQGDGELTDDGTYELYAAVPTNAVKYSAVRYKNGTKQCYVRFYSGNYLDLGKVKKIDGIESNVTSLTEIVPLIKDKTDLLKIQYSANLVNPSKIEENTFINVLGEKSTDNYASVEDIPVEAGSTYIIKNSDWQSITARAFSFKDANGTNIRGQENQSEIIIPNNAVSLTISVYNNYMGNGLGVFKNDVTSWSDYSASLELNYVKSLSDKEEKELITKADIIPLIPIKEGLSLTVNGDELTFTSGEDWIKCAKQYHINNVFNFVQRKINGVTNYMDDDVAPVHLKIGFGVRGTANNNMTVGANHGFIFSAGTIQSHGKTNADIGTEWLDGNNQKFYIAKIIDENTIFFIPENVGTAVEMAFPYLETGTLTSGGSSMVVTAVDHNKPNGWLTPSFKNHNVQIFDSNGKEIVINGEYHSEYFDVVEEYDLMNPASVLANLKARQQMSPIPTTDPVFDGDSMIKVKNTYRVLGNLSVVVSATIVPLQTVSIVNYMFVQGQRIHNLNTPVYYYVPGSKIVGANDFTKPVNQSWNIPSVNLVEGYWNNPQVPVNRVLQFGGYGFAIGYLKYTGVGTDLANYTQTTFELRGDTGKVYPHGVESAEIGNPLAVGQIYTAVMYRANIFDYDITKQRISCYHFTAFDGHEYIFADYSDSGIDTININMPSIEGKKIEVVESSNVTLLGDTYNQGAMVSVNYVEDETAYIVLKI